MGTDNVDEPVSSAQHNYDLDYFTARNQDKDRPALWFYERIIHRWIMPGTVLDYGCGTGFLLRRLSRYYSVAGYDISSDALSAARCNLPGLKVFGKEDPFPPDKFSGIVCLHVLEHIARAEIPSVLLSWHNALRSGGRVVCVVPDADGRGHALSGKRWTGFGDPSHITLIGHEEWRKIFAANGFSVCKTGTDGLWCLPYREGKNKILDGFRFAIPTLLQFLIGRLILPVGTGESAVYLLQKVDHED
jgi:SAM-dependent methyltransferase